MPKVGFAAAKSSTEWSFWCEISLFHFAMRFAAAKWMLLCCEVALVCQNCFRSCEMPSQRLLQCCEMVWQQNADFAEAAKSRRPLFFSCFSLRLTPIFAPILLRFFSFNFFAIPLDFDHPKTYITSKQTRIKALKSKLKH